MAFFSCLEPLHGRLNYFTNLAPEEVMAYEVKIVFRSKEKNNYITIYFLSNLQSFEILKYNTS